MIEMRRREFIALIGGAAAAWPRVAHAQVEHMRRLGVLMGFADDLEGQARVAALRDGLEKLGWVERGNLRVDYRWGGGDADRLRAAATELAGMAPDVIAVGGATALAALQQASRTAQIVFVGVTDPVGAGFVASLARPGGNATGFTQFEYGISGKWLELL